MSEKASSWFVSVSPQKGHLEPHAAGAEVEESRSWSWLRNTEQQVTEADACAHWGAAAAHNGEDPTAPPRQREPPPASPERGRGSGAAARPRRRAKPVPRPRVQRARQRGAVDRDEAERGSGRRRERGGRPGTGPPRRGAASGGGSGRR